MSSNGVALMLYFKFCGKTLNCWRTIFLSPVISSEVERRPPKELDQFVYTVQAMVWVNFVQDKSKSFAYFSKCSITLILAQCA